MAALPPLVMVLTTILSTAPVSYLIKKCSICFQRCSPFIFCWSAFHWSHEKFLCANCTVINPFFVLCAVFWHVKTPAHLALDGASCCLSFFLPNVRQPFVFWGWPQHRNFVWCLTLVQTLSSTCLAISVLSVISYIHSIRLLPVFLNPSVYNWAGRRLVDFFAQ